MADREYSTSPDPISIMADSSPVHFDRKASPLKSMHHNGRSSRKSIILEPTDADGTSPFRLKLTIEAQTAAPPSTRINRQPILPSSHPQEGSSSLATFQGVTVRDRSARRRPRKSAGTPGAAHLTSSHYVGADTPDWARHDAPKSDLSLFRHDDTAVDSGIEYDVPGDATTMENEEFSMISVESLSSRHGKGVHKKSQLIEEKPNIPTHNNAKQDTTWSYMPSSPPVFQAEGMTPQIAQTPLQPPAPLQTMLKFPSVTTPLRQSVVRSGKVLQDIVRTPDHGLGRLSRQNPSHSLFAGFSSNARRELHKSLQLGINLAETQPSPKHSVPFTGAKSQDSGIQYPDLSKAQIDHRLPTPEELERELSNSTVSNGPPVYPDVSEAQVQPATNVSQRSYDVMSWAPTGPANRSSPVRQQQSVQRPSTAVNSPAVVEISSEISEIEDEDGEDEEDDDLHGLAQDMTMDMWQEEAVRPTERPNQPSTADSPIKPANVHAPPTPVSTDHPSDVIHSQAAVSTGGPSVAENEDHLDSPISDVVSQEGEDTGLFWQNNMPNVYSRRRRDQPVSSFISELKPISSDAPSIASSRRSSRIPTKVHQAKPLLADHITKSKTLSSPLRRSLLRSSKISDSGPSYVSSGLETSLQASRRSESAQDITQPTEESFDDSTAADVRQLRSEISDQIQQFSNVQDDEDSENDEMSDLIDESDLGQSWIESTELHVSRSYVENLNIDSPAKIAVKFNDSDLQPQPPNGPSDSPIEGTPRPIINVSNLSPSKKKYGALFEEDAPLGAQDASESATGHIAEPIHQQTQMRKAFSPSKSLISQMTDSLWSAVTPKSAPSPRPKVILEQQEVSLGSATVTAHTASMPDLTLRLRRKYGILDACQPFTLFHAHTLRRLWLSCIQHPDRTLVPLSKPLSPELADLFNLPGRPSETNIKIASAFMDLLVTNADAQSGKWGDETAAKLKGWDSRGRHGSWVAFAGDTREDKVARAMRGEIEIAWVLQVLGDIVSKAEKERN